uniref:CCHC-type domain-containing protein n=1 Tax=Anabas testudineus TaxID=64144 RepID=A0AAQ6IB43_ANATE
MDPANLGNVAGELEAQAKAIRCHEQQLEDLTLQLQHLTLQQRSDTSPVAAAAREPHLPPPERFSGDPEVCAPFITQCTLIFALQPSSFPSEDARIAYIISLLSGPARQWGTAEWDRRSTICSSVQAFTEAMRKVFNCTAPSKDASRRLLRIAQGARSVNDYAVDFRTVAARSKWNEDALFDVFYQGLSPTIKDELATRDLPDSLDDLVDLATRVDLRLRERMEERRQENAVRRRPLPAPLSSAPPPRLHKPAPDSDAHSVPAGDAPEPMQLGRSRLSPEERQRRIKGNLCLYCGSAGHYLNRCPAKDRAHQGQ